MANRNKRKNTRGFIVPLPVASILIVAAALLLLYVWQETRSHILCARIKFLEQQQVEVTKRWQNEQGKWNNLKSPANIDRMLARYKIEMIWPAENCIMRLIEPDLAGHEPERTGDMAGLWRHPVRSDASERRTARE